jgi:glycine betaine/choline ABC-type transport system substrate-binding protein
MRAMNYAADVEHRDIHTIAREFIAARITRESRTSP